MSVFWPGFWLWREAHVLVVCRRQFLGGEVADRPPLPVHDERDALVMGTIYEDESGNLLWKSSLVGARIDATQRGAHENVRGRDVRTTEEQVQIIHNLLDAIIGGPTITPCVSGAIVGTDPGVFGNLPLHQCPLHGKTASTVFNDDCRRSGSCAL